MAAASIQEMRTNIWKKIRGRGKTSDGYVAPGDGEEDEEMDGGLFAIPLNEIPG